MIHPQIVNRVIFPLHERLRGKDTHARLADLERTQWLRPAEVAELQFRQVRRHLEFAYREVPYYTRLLDEHGLQPWRVQSLEDFRKIPCLTRNMLRQHFDALQPRTKLRGVVRISTGGSTGAPVTVLVDRDRSAFTDAARLRAHRWFGADIGAREIVLWGSPLELTKQDRLRNFRDRLINSRLLSAFDLGEASLARYAEVLRRIRPQKLYGYASALYLLARYLDRTGWKGEPGLPRVVFATAEPLYDFQRTLLGRVFGCPVSVEYGARDAGLIATECPEGGLHIPAEGMLVEPLQGSGGTDGELAELVVTNTQSFALPLIRYRTGDMGALEPAPCACGRGLPRLRAVEGRRTDFLITPGGKVMHALALIYVLREEPAIREFQVIQEALDRLVVRIVPAEGFTDATRTALASGLAQRFDGPVSVEIQLVNAIERLPSGKHRYVVSHVADAYLNRLFGEAEVAGHGAD